jgi:hypothetical protein
MDKRFMVLLQASFLREENHTDEILNLSLHIAFQLVHPSLDNQRNSFIGCDCHIEMHYTPKKGSWLNIAELELSALARICLSRRLGSVAELDREIHALVKERNKLKIKVDWQFSIPHARAKLQRHYEKVQSKN